MRNLAGLAVFIVVCCGSWAAESAFAQIVPLNKQKTVLLDRKGKRLLLKGKVVLREGVLEMFCCLENTKEHESVLAVDTEAYVVHTGLLALGAKSGSPARFEPKYKPATGQKIDIFVDWTDKQGKRQRATAQSWIRYATHRFYGEQLDAKPDDLEIPEESELRYDGKFKELSWYGPMTEQEKRELLALSKYPQYRKAIESFHRRSQPREMDAHWVFSGSGSYADDETGVKYYLAEVGDLICVANFPSATLDLSIESSASEAAGLLFEPYAERIPPLGTEVTIELVPVFPKEKKPGDILESNDE